MTVPKKDEKCVTCGFLRNEHMLPIWGDKRGMIIGVHWCADAPGKRGLICLLTCTGFKKRKKRKK